MVGESAVGKSSLTIRFVSNHFKEHGQPTIGASFLSKTLPIQQTGRSIKFNIWDTAGQEKYRSLASLYYRGVDIAIIVYDITNRVSLYAYFNTIVVSDLLMLTVVDVAAAISLQNSFEQVQDYWVQELQHQCFGSGGLQVPTYLLDLDFLIYIACLI